MKATAAIAGALLALAGTATFAQETTREQLNQRPQQMQPGQASASPSPGANDASQGGVPGGTSSSGGTLMQRREQGMSPDTSQAPARGAKSTGTMKQ